MPTRDTTGRAAPLPAGIEYAPNGQPVLAYAVGDRELGPVEALLADRPRNPEASPLDTSLDDFTTATLLLDEARQLVDRTARSARQNGASWSQLARRAGITPQSAQQRWSDDGNARHNQRRKARAQGSVNTEEKDDGR